MINLAKPTLDDKEVKAAGKVILSGWVTQGPKVIEFETEFAKYVNSKYACAVSSCTTALHIALLTVGVKPGDAVITVSHSFIATANCIRNCGAEPLFIDIASDSFNISVNRLKKYLKEECEQREDGLYSKNFLKKISQDSPCHRIKEEFTGRIAAILPVHQMGMPCEIEEIVNFSKEYNLPVVEDAACAIGSEIKFNHTWEKIGKPHGDIACFSFHPRKVITTGDGGMLTTSHHEFDTNFRLLRQHGMNVPDLVRHNTDKLIVEDYVVSGFNYRMTDIQAAIGIEQVKKLPAIIKSRNEIDQLYRTYFNDVEWIQLPQKKDTVISNWQSYPVHILNIAPISRDNLIQILLENNISSKPGIMNSHTEKPYSSAVHMLNNSESARNDTILIPFFVGLEKDDIVKIVNVFKKIS